MTTKTPLPASVRGHEAAFPDPVDDDLSSHFHRQFIGYLGMSLPVLLWIIAGLRPTEGLERWDTLKSVSAYYYTGGVAAFVGILITLAVYLFSYQGYKNEYRRLDRIAAIIAGGAAVLVAFFPTEAPGKLTEPFWWTPRTDTIHYISAIVLFGSFIFFSLFLFPKSSVKKAELPRDKRVRNRIYIFCGVAMVVCMVWAGVALYRNSETSIFWPESLALEFFAVSWLVKGRVIRTVVVAGSRTLNYLRHPGQLVGEVWSAIRG
jgi:multisubunit Na+/H+ antiporter MnhB subunit